MVKKKKNSDATSQYYIKNQEVGSNRFMVFLDKTVYSNKIK
jgi:hypothetical protein